MEGIQIRNLSGQQCWNRRLLPEALCSFSDEQKNPALPGPFGVREVLWRVRRTHISIKQLQLPAWDSTASSTGSRQEIHNTISPSTRTLFRMSAVSTKRLKK